MPHRFRRRNRSRRLCFERNDLERNADDDGNLLSPEVLILRSSQSASYYLLTKELRLEWTQSDDVRNCQGVPSLREHGDRNDAPNVSPGRNRWVFPSLNRDLQPLARNFTTWPVAFADCAEDVA